jgi:hypothetical protein
LTGACPNEEDDMATTPYEDPIVDTLDANGADAGVAGAESGNRMTETARGLASTVSEAASAAAPKITEAAGSTAEAVREADRAIRSTSDQGLGLIGALSLGSAIGLLVGGANRFLVALSLVPAIMVAKAIVDRMDEANGRSTGLR